MMIMVTTNEQSTLIKEQQKEKKPQSRRDYDAFELNSIDQQQQRPRRVINYVSSKRKSDQSYL